MRRGLTLIELIFVIIVIGILAGLAVPKFFEVSKEAFISKAQSKVSAIRAGLQTYKTKHILQGQSPYPATLDSNSSSLFDQVLPTATTPGTKPGEWERESNTTYKFHLNGNEVIIFDYDKTKGTFSCNKNRTTTSSLCNNF